VNPRGQFEAGVVGEFKSLRVQEFKSSRKEA
jgi:hypothetical protein